MDNRPESNKSGPQGNSFDNLHNVSGGTNASDPQASATDKRDRFEAFQADIDRKESTGRILKGWLTGCVIAIVVVVVIIILTPSMLCARRPAWQSRAKGTLRSIGSSQLSYQGTNDMKFFGTFNNLQDDLYIADGYTLGNMIENYSMTWEALNYSTVSDEGIEVGVRKFTVVAYPRDTRKGYLNTFGVTEDQVVRVYNPDNKSNQFTDMNHPNVSTWDPIL